MDSWPHGRSPSFSVPKKPGELAALVAGASLPDPALAQAVGEALADELPLLKRDGGFIRSGFDPALDEARGLRDESRRIIASLQVRYAEETGIRSLKIKHNNVLGYFVEVAQQYGDTFLKPPLNETYIHRQTLAGAMRFSTTELSGLEAKIAGAAERSLGIEQDHFDRLEALVLASAGPIKQALKRWPQWMWRAPSQALRWSGIIPALSWTCRWILQSLLPATLSLSR